MSIPLIIFIVVFPALMAYAAVSDLVSMTISNRLCLSLVALFLPCALLLGFSWNEIGWHFAAGSLVLVVSFGLFAAGWIGGGDAKLVAATALWLGFGALMPYLLIAAVLGAALTVSLLWARKMPIPTLAENWPWVRRLHAANQGVPYGIALAFSALYVLPETAIWRAAIGL